MQPISFYTIIIRDYDLSSASYVPETAKCFIAIIL